MSTISYRKVVHGLRSVFQSGKTLPVDFRVKQLQSFLEMVEKNEAVFCSALAEDLRKPSHESFICELDILRNEIVHTLNHLRDWVKPEKTSKTLPTILDKSFIKNDPYGIVLILGAWNYPIQLSLLPAVGAIAAGNVIIIKPSELASASSKVLAELVPRYLDNDCYKVIEGGIPESSALLEERFDYIFYTGGCAVAKIVRAAANKHLTPVLLELGGKSPTFIDSTCNMELAVKRLMWGKFINLGQTCIAPDYVLCEKKAFDNFLKTSQRILKEMFGEDPSQSSDLCRIINEKHFQRVSQLLRSGGRAAIGGEIKEDEKYISPTVLVDVNESDPVMQEEIFGPLLPVITVNNEDEAIDFINNREKPLVLYVMSAERKIIDKFIDKTSSGSVCCNDTMIHMSVPYLPFGGIGMSGDGCYHGKATYQAFCHRKSVLIRDYNFVGEKLAEGRYAPYKASNLPMLRWLLSEKNIPSCKYLPHFLCFVMGFAMLLIIRATAKASGHDLPFPF